MIVTTTKSNDSIRNFINKFLSIIDISFFITQQHKLFNCLSSGFTHFRYKTARCKQYTRTEPVLAALSG